MSNKESLQQALSALLDNQADDLQLQRILQSLDDSEVRETWVRYNVARDASLVADAQFAGVDLSAGIKQAIEQAEDSLDTQTSEQPAARSMPVFGRLSKVAIAASVTLAVLAGVRFFNQSELASTELTADAGEPMEMLEAVGMPGQTSELTSFNESKHSPVAEALEGEGSWHNDRLPEYLRRHAQQAPTHADSQVTPVNTAQE
ncbi:sigma-E factor negative regulatory protein [Thiopseudomonas alkaliphila]|uniref:sigma-E factor negative regulatory protein n=1 Tax=Thiopseudomonas alkaliphila TaxID=1697053 RepID=UPI00257708AD|nr:RseA family anti-sigma factor [Thiopseudomonas alkaliphila]MDM1715760.1 hypothetical protein [Thiopseudomonas alkaliphila]